MKPQYEYLKYSLRLEPEQATRSDQDYQMKNAEDVHLFLRDVCSLHRKSSEEILVIATDRKNQVLGWHQAAIGSVDSVYIGPREVFKFALAANAVNVILAHNHLSGDVLPSETDKETTQRLAEAGELIGIPVIDHLIIGEDQGYVSFRKEGLLPQRND